MSGDCELQNLGYRYGIDHWAYPTYTKAPVDAAQVLLMDTTVRPLGRANAHARTCGKSYLVLRNRVQGP